MAHEKVVCGVGQCTMCVQRRALRFRSVASSPHILSNAHVLGAVVRPAISNKLEFCGCDADAYPALPFAYPAGRRYALFQGKLNLLLCTQCRRVREPLHPRRVTLSATAAAASRRMHDFRMDGRAAPRTVSIEKAIRLRRRARWSVTNIANGFRSLSLPVLVLNEIYSYVYKDAEHLNPVQLWAAMALARNFVPRATLLASVRALEKENSKLRKQLRAAAASN